MSNSKQLKTAIVSAVVAAGLTVGAHQAMAAKPGFEKCYGVVRAGKNDCGTKTHACAAQAKKDGMKDEWMYMPKGFCERIVNGSTTKPKD